MRDMSSYFNVSVCTCQCLTHIEYGDDGGVISADYSRNVLRLGDLRGDQLKVREKREGGEIEVQLDVRKRRKGETGEQGAK